MVAFVAEKLAEGRLRIKPIGLKAGEKDNIGPTYCHGSCRVFCGLVNGLACTNFMRGQITSDLTYQVNSFTAEQALQNAGCSPTFFG